MEISKRVQHSLADKAASSMSIQARRHHPRVKLGEAAYINFGSGNRGVVLDVSEAGLRFKIPSPLDSADSVRFWLTFGHRTEGTADLVWTNESRTVGGLHFTAVPPEVAAQIEGWIRGWIDGPPQDAASLSKSPIVNTVDAVDTVDPRDTVNRVDTADTPVESFDANQPAPNGDEPPALSLAAGAILMAQEDEKEARKKSEELGEREAEHAAEHASEHASENKAGLSPASRSATSPATEYASPVTKGHSPRLSEDSPVSPDAPPRPAFPETKSSLSMFPAEKSPTGRYAYTRPRSSGARRAAAVALALLIALSAAAAFLSYRYPTETRTVMARVQDHVSRWLNLPHQQGVSNAEHAGIGESQPPFESAPPAPDVAAPAGPMQPPASQSRSVEDKEPSTGSAPDVSPEANHAAPSATPSDTSQARNNSDADVALAQTYLKEGSDPDQQQKAVQLLWLATEKGNVDAEIQLADLYTRGVAVQKSCVQARILLKAAVTANPAAARQKLDDLDKSGCS